MMALFQLLVQVDTYIYFSYSWNEDVVAVGRDIGHTVAAVEKHNKLATLLAFSLLFGLGPSAWDCTPES